MVLQLPASLVSTIQSSQLQLLEDVHADDSNFSFDYDEFLLGQQQQPPHSMVDGDYAWLLNIEVPLGTALCGVLCMGFMLFKGISVGISVTVEDLETGTFEYIDATTVMGLHPDSILGRRRQYYRLWTHLFLHSDGTHLLHNMLGLLQWGPRAENLVGTLRLLETSLFWAVALEFVWLVILTRIVPGLGDTYVVGFSGILFFWKALAWGESYGGDNLLSWGALLFLITDEIAGLKKGNLGSLFHLLGFVNGCIYRHFLQDRIFLLPKIVGLERMERWEAVLADRASDLMKRVGLHENFLYFVDSPILGLDDDESDDDDEQYQEMASIRRQFALKGMVICYQRNYAWE